MVYHVSDEHTCSCWQDGCSVQECCSLTGIYTPWRIRSLPDRTCTSRCRSRVLSLQGCTAWAVSCCAEDQRILTIYWIGDGEQQYST